MTARRLVEALALPIATIMIGTAHAQTPSTERDGSIAQARAALARHDPRSAIVTLEKARTADPDDPDLLRLLGSSYAFDRQYDAAIQTLEHARSLAPADLDIRAALARAYLWSDRRQAALSEVEAIETRDPANAEASAIRLQLAKPATQVEARLPSVGIAFSQSIAGVELDSGPERTWWTTTLGLFGDVAEGATLAAEVEREDREVAIDTHLLARLDYRFSPHLRGYVAAGATPDADFRERWSLRGGIEGDVLSYLAIGADLRHANYGSANVTAFEPVARLRIPTVSGTATVRMINLWDEAGTHRSGWSGRLDTELRDGSALFAGAATYPDTEAGITRRVRSVFVGAALPIAERTTLRATGEYERRTDSYTRKSLTLGLQFRL